MSNRFKLFAQITLIKLVALFWFGLLVFIQQRNQQDMPSGIPEWSLFLAIVSAAGFATSVFVIIHSDNLGDLNKAYLILLSVMVSVGGWFVIPQDGVIKLLPTWITQIGVCLVVAAIWYTLLKEILHKPGTVALDDFRN